VGDIKSDGAPVMKRGDRLTLTASVKLGNLAPGEVRVELYHGAVSSQGVLSGAATLPMECSGTHGEVSDFSVTVTCTETGRQGYAVRVLPTHPSLVSPYVPGLVRWA
jgi:glycogen phosphorylase